VITERRAEREEERVAEHVVRQLPCLLKQQAALGEDVEFTEGRLESRKPQQGRRSCEVLVQYRQAQARPVYAGTGTEGAAEAFGRKGERRTIEQTGTADDRAHRECTNARHLGRFRRITWHVVAQVY
jgi:hypothetical protein